MPDARQNEGRLPTPKWALLFVLAWAGSIFATSCTVISTYELFAIISYICGPEAARRFEIFWGIVWFVVVKGWHATEFAILTVGLVVLFNTWHHTSGRRAIVLAGTLSVLFAASDEWHQTFVPNRDGTVSDMLIDCLGITIVTLYLVARRREPVLAIVGGCAEGQRD
jgi:VanZ like family